MTGFWASGKRGRNEAECCEWLFPFFVSLSQSVWIGWLGLVLIGGQNLDFWNLCRPQYIPNHSLHHYHGDRLKSRLEVWRALGRWGVRMWYSGEPLSLSTKVQWMYSLSVPSLRLDLRLVWVCWRFTDWSDLQRGFSDYDVSVLHLGWGKRNEERERIGLRGCENGEVREQASQKILSWEDDRELPL